MEKYHLKAIDILCEYSPSKSSLWYRHFLNTKYNVEYDKTNINERFYYTMLRHKKITLKMFEKEENKFVQYFQTYKTLEKNINKKILIYNLTKKDLKKLNKIQSQKDNKYTIKFLESTTNYQEIKENQSKNKNIKLEISNKVNENYLIKNKRRNKKRINFNK